MLCIQITIPTNLLTDMADNQGGGSGGRDSRDLVQKKESMAIRIVLDRLNPKDAFKHRRDAEKDGPPKYDHGKLSQALETVELTDPFHSRVDKVMSKLCKP